METRASASLTPEQALQHEHDTEWLLCYDDFWYWLANYGVIVEEDTGNVIRGIQLWPAQRIYLQHIVDGDNVITGKSRQVGVSWLIENREYWLLEYRDRLRMALIHYKDDEAMTHIERVKLIHRHQPEFLARKAIVPGHDSKHEYALGSKDTYSIIEGYACTEGAGRGVSATLVHCEEFAFWPPNEARAVFAAIRATAGDKNRQIVIISTANGEGNLYHELWQKAEAGDGSFVPVFIPWDANPARDQAWYDSVSADLMELMRQEYPATADEMFIASGTKYFDLERLVLFGLDGNPLEPGQKNEPLTGQPQGWTVYALPIEGREYAVGVDTADGGGDACSADVVDVKTGLQVCQVHSAQWGWDRFADEVHAALLTYNGAFLLPEQNNHGHALIHYLNSVKGYNRIYRYEDYDIVKRTGLQRLGWNNNVKTRPELLGKLKTAIRDMAIKPMHQPSITEMRAFEYNSRMRVEAKAGMHDDRVFSLALANMGMEYIAAHLDDNFVMVL